MKALRFEVKMEENLVALHCPECAAAMTLCEQKARFARWFPDDVVVLQLGRLFKLLPGPIQAAAEMWDSMSLLSQRFQERDERKARRLLWPAALPATRIGETGRRVGAVAERALVSRWACKAVSAS